MKLEFHSLSKSFGDKQIFDQMNEAFDSTGKITTILGESGSGKSTLLNILFGIDQEYEGTYSIDGLDTKNLSDTDWDYLRSQRIQIVYQDFKLLEKFTVEENLYFANRIYTVDYLKRKSKLLALLNLESIEHTLVKDISGGQKQRVAIARALLNDPEVLLLDEPTGNLDQENTIALFDYLKQIKEQGKSIYVITHDDRITSYSDTIYLLENHQLVLQTKTNVQIEKIKKRQKIKKRKKIKKRQRKNKNKISIRNVVKYIQTDLFRNKSHFFVTSIPLILILSVFTLLFTGFKQTTLDSFTDLFKGLAENVLYIDTQTLTQKQQAKLNKQQIESSTDGKRLYFSKVDFKKMEQLNNVEKIIPFNLGNFILDEDNNELQENIDTKDFPEEFKQLNSFSTAPSLITFSFQSLLLPNKDLYYYNPNHVKVVSGRLPETKQEVLVPDFYKRYLELLNEYSDTISLNVKDSSDNFSKKNYLISGTYETNYKNTFVPQMRINGSNAFPIYIPYRDSTDLDTLKSQNSYEDYKKSESTNPQTIKYLKSIYDTYDDYFKSIGTGNGSVLIVAKKEEAVPEVTKEIEKLFPYYQIRSRYSLKNGEFSITYRKLVFTLLAGLSIASILMIIIFVFLNKQVISQKKKELATLFSLGYSKLSVKSIIGSEIVIQFLAIYFISMCVVWVFDEFYLSKTTYSTYFVNIFSLENQLLLLLVILLTSFFSTLWGVSSVNKKRLVENLK